MLSPGDTIDRYTVEALVGSGGTAVVYRIRHTQLGTLHALKVLSVTSDVIRQRMLMEGRVQAAMRHPNVVAVTDVLSVDGAPGLLMEYIEGPSLDRALKKYKINLKASETLFLGIVAGVRQAHLHGLVHRDLKPANVMLARTSDGFVPKVTDFGLAKVLEEAANGGGHTRSGIALGTPAYMAPEQIRDARGVDQGADLFALGCLLYELVTRRRAFPGDDTIAIYNHVLDGRYVPPRHYCEDIPDRIDNAIRGCLIPDRQARIPDTETLLAVLRGDLLWEIPDLPPLDEDLLPAPDDVGAPDLPLSTTGSVVDPPREKDPLWASLPGNLRPPPPPSDPPPRNHSGLLFLGGAGLAFLLALVFAGVAVTMAVLQWLEAPEVEQPSVALATGADLEPPEDPVVAAPVPAPVAEPVTPEPEPRVAAVTPPRPTPPPAPSPVVVKILSSPPTATFKVDGVEQGRTPAKLQLEPGPHDVWIQSGEHAGRFSIDVQDGAENKWCYSFGSAEARTGSCPPG